MNHFLQSLEHYSIPDLINRWDAVGEVILVHEKLAPDEEVFVDKMVQAFGWQGVESYHLIFNPELKINYQLLWAQKQIRLVIVFGISPPELGLNIQLRSYQLTFVEPFHIYYTDAVNSLARIKENKARIWNDLRYLKLIPELKK